MTSIHAATGIACAAVVGAIALWALAVKLLRRPPGRAMNLVARAACGLLVLQGLFGAILTATHHRSSGLHYVYGVAALVVMVVGTLLADAMKRDGWVVLGWSAFVAGLLVMRALMTGSR
jgi:hypothetical protein